MASEQDRGVVRARFTPEDDPHDMRMRSAVRPADWAERVRDEYDFVAIGGGTAGLVATAGAAHLGARTLLVEKDLLGGDCLVTGCVPSKALLHAGSIARQVRNASARGIRTGQVKIDTAEVMRTLRATRATIAQTDGAERWRDRGVDVAFGRAKFTGAKTLTIDGRPIRFKRALIATGARPRIPEIPGLDEVAPLTSETVFELAELPRRIVVIGGGPIGSEISQAMARLGSEVTLVQKGAHLLSRDDPEAAELLAESLRADGVDLRLKTAVVRTRREADGNVVTLRNSDGETELGCQEVLVATGRVPNVKGIGLEEAGVAFDERGVKVDKLHRTSNRRIYAAGDVCSRLQFTHAAWAQAEYAVLNALLPVRFDVNARHIPHVTYTDPEVAHVGLSIEELARRGDGVHTLTVPITESDRARVEGETRGFARVHLRRGTDRPLAATVVGRNAGEVIAQLGLLIQQRRGLGDVAKTVYAYPTFNELVSRLADEYNFRRVTPGWRRLLRWWFARLR